ncbi:MAG: 16S rRNA (guanine(527)-N(7))-methyltransferase RsmG [Paracoccaceae bacterium]
MAKVYTSAEFEQEFNVSRETMDRLSVYHGLLLKWNAHINLVSNSTLDSAWLRHFADSAQIWWLAPKRAQVWLDMGSGAGFPGLVIAAIAKEVMPGLQMILIESDRRKSTFLRTVAREMDVNVQVLTQRIEEIPALNADIISARALAPIPQLLEFAGKHRKPEGICIFHKGKNADSELTATTSSWHISLKTFPSVTDSSAVILRIGEFRRA